MHLEYLRSTEKLMPIVGDPSAIRSVKVWHCKFESLASLGRFSNIESLVVANYPDDSFELLSGLKKLRKLELLHFPKVTDLSPLEKLFVLEELSLESLPSWDSSGKRIVVKSLAPLSNLPNLRSIELHGVVTKDRSLISLTKCLGLKHARISGYPRAEIDSFYRKLGLNNAK